MLELNKSLGSANIFFSELARVEKKASAQQASFGQPRREKVNVVTFLYFLVDLSQLCQAHRNRGEYLFLKSLPVIYTVYSMNVFIPDLCHRLYHNEVVMIN